MMGSKQIARKNEKRNKSGIKKRSFRRLLMEQLEDRRVLAAVAWTGSGGNLLWSNPANWSTNQLPGLADDVTIDAPGNVTILYNSNEATTVRSLSLADSLQLSAGSIDVSGAISITPGNTLTVAGVGVEFAAHGTPAINGTNLHVSNGGRLSLPSVTSFAHGQGAHTSVTLRATGTGSILELSNLETLIGANANNAYVVIDALTGGTVNLSGMTEIVDPEAGNLSGRAVRITADGSGSYVDLASLQSFQDRSSAGNGYSSLTVTNGGEIAFSDSLSASHVKIAVDQTSVLLGGHLVLATGTILTGHGNVFANVTNASGTVIPEGAFIGLTLHGTYAQFENGTFQAAVDGTIESGNYSRLIVLGEASLGGELQITRAGNFTPDVFSDYPLLSAYSVNGAFDTITDSELDGDDLSAIYGASVVVLSRIFDRNPFASFNYENMRGKQRSYLDVRHLTGENATFRVYSPSGDLVTLSNATPANPNLGDAEAFELPALGNYEVRVYSPIGHGQRALWVR